MPFVGTHFVGTLVYVLGKGPSRGISALLLVLRIFASGSRMCSARKGQGFFLGGSTCVTIFRTNVIN